MKNDSLEETNIKWTKLVPEVSSVILQKRGFKLIDVYCILQWFMTEASVVNLIKWEKIKYKIYKTTENKHIFVNNNFIGKAVH